jgi:hypothetical protein
MLVSTSSSPDFSKTRAHYRSVDLRSNTENLDVPLLIAFVLSKSVLTTIYKSQYRSSVEIFDESLPVKGTSGVYYHAGDAQLSTIGL